MSDIVAGLAVVLQLIFVDLLLGADNAIVIALACRNLEPGDARRAAFLGAGGAILLRLVLAAGATALIGIPFVNLVAAWMLMVIALNLRRDSLDEQSAEPHVGAPAEFFAVAAVIISADAAMSLDNVVALVAIADGNFWLLGIGVLLSIPVIVYGALFLTEIMRKVPELVLIGAAFLGWIAGGMAVTDPLIAGWIDANAPALGLIAPALCAAFIVLAGNGGPAPEARPRPAPLRTPAPFAERPRRAALPASLAANAGRTPATLPASSATSAEIVRETVPFSTPTPAAPADASRNESPRSGWTEERLVIAGFVALAVLAGLIILVASFFDSLT